MKTLGALHAKWVESRGISAETAVKFGLYTATNLPDVGVLPSPNGNILVFPTIEHGVEVNEKFRGPNKKFWQRQGGRKTFFNSDILDDPALERGDYALIITEGEMDCLAATEAGHPFVVSVPDGAPPVPEGKRPDDLEPLDPGADQTGKYEFLWNNRERLKKIKRFIIATDNDPPGRRLAAELVRRLSASRCMFLTFPEGDKDINDTLMRGGAAAVTQLIQSAKPYPVRGLYRLSDYPDREGIETFSTEFPGMDDHFQIYPGEFFLVTGVPSDGKSTWTNALIVNMAERHGWSVALFSPETPTVPQLRDEFRRLRIGGDPWSAPAADLASTDKWIDRHIVFIDADPTGQSDDDDFTLEWVLDRATDAVLRDGIRMLVIDPWNELDHARGRSETTADYLARSIRSLKRWGKLYEVAVGVVAHPTTDVKSKDGKSRVPGLYDVDGGAMWRNKCDHGIVIDRPDKRGNQVIVHMKKVRFRGTGKVGEVALNYNEQTGRYGWPNSDMLELK